MYVLNCLLLLVPFIPIGWLIWTFIRDNFIPKPVKLLTQCAIKLVGKEVHITSMGWVTGFCEVVELFSSQRPVKLVAVKSRRVMVWRKFPTKGDAIIYCDANGLIHGHSVEQINLLHKWEVLKQVSFTQETTVEQAAQNWRTILRED